MLRILGIELGKVTCMRSMTGYGRGEVSDAEGRWVVEIRGVNRRQAEILVNVPRDHEDLEVKVKARILPLLQRGRCEVRISGGMDVGSVGVRLDEGRAVAYAEALRGLAERLGISGEVKLELLLRCPGVFEASGGVGGEETAEARWASLEPALEAAWQAFDGMREREGAALSDDLKERVRRMRECVGRVTEQAPEVLRRYRRQLLERVRAAGVEGVVEDDERLLKEVVLFADRSDVSEELARLGSHFVQFEDCLGSSEAVGRKLDFLAQEMHREINTIGSKGNDGVISQAVVELKTEVERFREQAQNIE